MLVGSKRGPEFVRLTVSCVPVGLKSKWEVRESLNEGQLFEHNNSNRPDIGNGPRALLYSPLARRSSLDEPNHAQLLNYSNGQYRGHRDVGWE
jgi:hypothetical protein